MASAPQETSLPILYNNLVPLNLEQHGDWKSRSTDKATWLVDQHAIPLTVEEFILAHRHYPIVFSAGPTPVPLALMGLNEGVNVFVDPDGKVTQSVYVPAYARRYPFMLARLRPDKDELSLCFDPTPELLGKFDDGLPLFDGDQPSESCKATLEFCEQFEVAGRKTASFVEELEKHDLLIDGELNIETNVTDKPVSYRGFKMVSEEKLRELRGDLLRTWNQNGILPLIFAHLFSLNIARDIFALQLQQGKGPVTASPQPQS